MNAILLFYKQLQELKNEDNGDRKSLNRVEYFVILLTSVKNRMINV
jgi:hypothetical protein